MKKLLKNLYHHLPFKKLLYTGLKQVWIPPAKVYQHLHFNDTIRIDAGAGNSFQMVHYGHELENEIFWKGLYGGWEKYSMSVWATLAVEAKVIFDIGANTGLYSLVAKSTNRNAAVHAFEPFGAICKKLAHNAAINRYNVVCNCLAVSDYTGDGVIYTADENFAYSVTVNQNLWTSDKDAIKLDIKTTTLKDYIEEHGITGIDLMKIDVETHEPEVMAGFSHFFNLYKPILLIEILNEEVAAALAPYFPAGDFDIYNIDELSGIKKVASLSKSDYYNFLIVPVEKAHLYNEKSFIRS